MLEIGTTAPEFTLPDQNGQMHSLSDYRGQKVILYFYPKDMTSGCTSQACNFRDLYPQFMEKGAVVLGVSKDSIASHKKFEESHGLPFPLLSDADLSVIRAYDVLKPGKDGKPSKSLVRTTYLIDENGVIEKAFGGVKPKDNAAQMLAELKTEEKPAESKKEEKIVQTAGREQLGEFAPMFAHLNDDVLFGEVWNENAIDVKTKCIITVVSLMASGITDSSLTYHLQNAKAHGVTKEEIAAIITHATMYVGWPKGWAVFRLAKEVWS
jgi:peroxiredoxin Q/BCP